MLIIVVFITLLMGAHSSREGCMHWKHKKMSFIYHPYSEILGKSSLCIVVSISFLMIAWFQMEVPKKILLKVFCQIKNKSENHHLNHLITDN